MIQTYLQERNRITDIENDVDVQVGCFGDGGLKGGARDE